MHRSWKDDSSKKTLLVASALSLVSQMVPCEPCLALSLTFGGKKAALQSPGYAKLTDGAGPETNDLPQSLDRTDTAQKATEPSAEPYVDNSAEKTAETVVEKTAPLPVEKPAAKKAEKVAKSAEQATKTAAKKTDVLAPLTLNDDKNGLAGEGSDGNFLKSTITESGFAPKAPGEGKGTTLSATSIKNAPVGNKMMDSANKVNAMPIPLMETASETDKKLSSIDDAEKAQLADLWEATLTRSPDIQFVVQRLMPTSNPNHTTQTMMKMLSAGLFGAVASVGMMAPSPGAYIGSQAGASMIANLISSQQAGQARKAQLSQTECIILYNMVRTTADKLVDYYRGYKKHDKAFRTASADLADLQNMVKEAKAASPGSGIEMEYTLRKQQRDMDAISEDAQRARQGLIDLAGGEAVAKLDGQISGQEAVIAAPTIEETTAPNKSENSAEEHSKIAKKQKQDKESANPQM